ncbi:MAG: hypothetical protein LBH09_01890 [Peptococcaceae bacterium]|nr:hypothetical protein [Peptococcaceae bacterium]
MAEEFRSLTIRRNINETQRRIRFILVVVGLVLLAGSLYSLSIYALSYMAGLGMVSEISWEKTLSGPAWVFQRELTIVTDEGGMLIPIVNEGDRVSKGLEIARLNYHGEAKLNEDTNRRLYSPVAGIVSFETDGLEIISIARDYNDLTVSALDVMVGPAARPAREGQGLAGIIQDRMVQENIEREEEQSGDGARQGGVADTVKTPPKGVPPGSAMVKVVDNLSDCYIYMRLPDQEEAPFAPVDSVAMKLEGVGDGKGTVLQCEAIKSGWGVLIKLDSGLETLRHGRQHQLSLVLGTESRAVVPLGSVVLKDGETGIYMTEKNRVRWKPVVVVDEHDEYQIIEGLEPGDIHPGDVIATRPWLIWDGMRFRG